MFHVGRAEAALDEANEEALGLHRENPDGAPGPTKAINPSNRTGLGPQWECFTEHCEWGLLAGLKKGVHTQKSLNMVKAVQQKPSEDPPDFLERIYQACGKYTDSDPQAPENMRMLNMTFISQSAP